MELRKGYKPTEVGVIPEDWEVKSVGEVLKVRHGKDQKHVKSENGVYPILGTGGLMGYSSKWLYNKESVLIGRKGTIDKPRFMNSPFWTVDTLFYTEVSEDYLAKFIYYKFLMIDWYSHNEASGVPSLNANTIEKIRIPLPPTLTEQTAIATALSDADALISSLEKLIEKKRAIKQGAMQELLKPKEGWVVKKLGEIADISGAGVDKKITPGELPITLVNYMDVYKRDYIYRTELNHVVTAPPSKVINCNVNKGDILLTPSYELRTDIGVSAIAMKDLEGVVYSYHLYRLRYFNKVDFLFGLYMLKTRSFLSQHEVMCEGSGKRYVVSMGKFRKMKVYLPKTISEQEEISKTLWDMDSEISSLEQNLSKYKMIKQGIMQELLTGKTRLV